MRRIEISKAICRHILAINQGIYRHAVYYPEPFEVFQDVPVEDGQVLVEPDVSHEVPSLPVPEPFNVTDKPLPCQMAIVDLKVDIS
jgi:hypothetical protein